MKINSTFFIVLFTLLLAGVELQAQYGYGNGYGGYGYGGRGTGYGRGRTAIPQAQTPQKEPEPLTADEIVDNEMPEIASALELNDFETAVLSSILKKYVQERIEMQILDADQMRDQMDKIPQRQTEELKAGLPLEKYEAFVELQKKGVSKTKKEKKKKEKRQKKKKKTDQG